MFVISTIVLISVFFLSGTLFNKAMRQNSSFPGAVMIGFLLQLSVFHVFYTVFRLLNFRFFTLYVVFSITLLTVAAVSIHICIKTQVWRTCCSDITNLSKHTRRHPAISIIFLVAMAIYLWVSFGFYYSTSDDSLYLPKAMEMLKYNSLSIPERIAWSGIENASFLNPPDFTSLEAWRAYWSKLFGVHVTVFSRGAMAMAVFVVSVCALYQIYTVLSRKKTYTGCLIFLSAYFILMAWDRNESNHAAFWGVCYSSQGKSILITVILPSLIAVCSRIIQCNDRRIPGALWMILGAILMSGIAITLNGIYWPILLCISIGLPFLIIERRRDFWKLVPKVILACIPVLIFAVLALIKVSALSSHYNSMPICNWEQAYYNGFPSNMIIPYVICILYIIMRGNKTARYIFAVSPVLLCATILNPLFIEPVSRYISAASVYYRLFWMLPVYIVIPFVMSDVFSGISEKAIDVGILFTLAATIVIYSGYKAADPDVPVSSRSRVIYFASEILTGGQKRENVYNLPESLVDICNEMLENVPEDQNVRIFWFSPQDNFMRQYSHRIEMIGGCRNVQQSKFDQPLEPGSAIPYEVYKEFIYNERNDFADPQRAYEELKSMKIDYIFVDSDSGFAMRNPVPAGFTPFGEGILPDICVYSID